MAVIRHHRPYVSMDYDDVDGLLNAMTQAIEDGCFESTTERAAHIGALIALRIIRHHEYVEYPNQFMSLFVHYLDIPADTEEQS